MLLFLSNDIFNCTLLQSALDKKASDIPKS